MAGGKESDKLFGKFFFKNALERVYLVYRDNENNNILKFISSTIKITVYVGIVIYLRA